MLKAHEFSHLLLWELVPEIREKREKYASFTQRLNEITFLDELFADAMMFKYNDSLKPERVKSNYLHKKKNQYHRSGCDIDFLITTADPVNEIRECIKEI